MRPARGIVAAVALSIITTIVSVWSVNSRAHADSLWAERPCLVHPGDPTATAQDLELRCTQQQYDALFSGLSRGSAPEFAATKGYLRQIPFNLNPAFTDVVTALFWKGENFITDGSRGWQASMTTPMGIPAFPAAVYPGTAYFDGKPANIFDYSDGPLAWVRDEMREVQPGLWIGYAYVDVGNHWTRGLDFMLETLSGQS